MCSLQIWVQCCALNHRDRVCIPYVHQISQLSGLRVPKAEIGRSWVESLARVIPKTNYGIASLLGTVR